MLPKGEAPCMGAETDCCGTLDLRRGTSLRPGVRDVAARGGEPEPEGAPAVGARRAPCGPGGQPSAAVSICSRPSCSPDACRQADGSVWQSSENINGSASSCRKGLQTQGSCGPPAAVWREERALCQAGLFYEPRCTFPLFSLLRNLFENQTPCDLRILKEYRDGQ